MGNIDKRIKPEEIVSSTNADCTTLVTEDMMLILSSNAAIHIPASWYQSDHSAKRIFFSRESDGDAIKKIAQLDVSEEIPEN